MAIVTRPRIVTLALALAGVAVFHLAGLPLPFLFGPMAACLLAALAGVRLQGTGQVGVGARTILGVAVGASVTPALLQQLPVMAASLALIPVFVAVIGLIGTPYFIRLCGFDPVTAFYAAMPGGLQDMVIFGQAAGGDVRALSLIHVTRVLVIVTVAPLILTTAVGATLSEPVGAPAADVPTHELALMVAAAIVGWKAGERIGLFGASILGPLLVSAAFSLLGLIHVRPPAEAILAAQFFIGTSLGASYVGVTVQELRRDVAAGVGFVLILAAVASIFAGIVVGVGLAPPLEGILAFAPGGQAEMTVLAIVTGADLGYVVIHHVARLIVVILGAPFAARLFRVRRGRAPVRAESKTSTPPG